MWCYLSKRQIIHLAWSFNNEEYMKTVYVDLSTKFFLLIKWDALLSRSGNKRPHAKEILEHSE